MSERTTQNDNPGSASGFSLQEIIDNATIGIFTSTPEGRYITVNPALARMHGYESPAEMIESITDIATQVYADPEDRKEFMRLMQEHGKVVEHECLFKRKDGTEFWVSRNVRVVKDKDGLVLAYHGFTTDITTRKNAELALLDAYKVFERILEATLSGYWIFNFQTKGGYYSPAFTRMFGYEVHELPSTQDAWQDLIFAEDLPGVLEAFDRHVKSRGREPFFNEVRYRHKNGSTIWVICAGQVIEWAPDGTPLQMVGCHLNITERKRAEEVLREERLRLANILKGTNVATWEWNVQTGEHVINARWAEIIGYTLEELEPVTIRTWENAVHPDDQKVVGAKLDLHFAERIPCFDSEYRMRHKAGHWVWVQDRGQVDSRTQEGKPLMMYGILFDITERKQAEEKIRTIYEQLRKANAEKDKLFTIIAHDLKSPMCGLVASTEMLANEPELLSEKAIRILRMELHKNAKNTLELLEDLLQWARMNQGNIDYAPTACSLGELVNMCLPTAQDMAKRKEIVIRSDIPHDVNVLVDQPLIKAVFRNILFNAIKFTPRRGDIVIKARQERQTVTVAIQDNGTGMDEQTLAKIFSLENKKRHLGTEGEKGTGLGLMLCKQFIEQHGGQIWAESEPGKGTTLFFTLPVSD